MQNIYINAFTVSFFYFQRRSFVPEIGSIYEKRICVYVSWGSRGWLYLSFSGSASHGWVPWFLSVRVSVCNPDFSELVRYLWTCKNDNGGWTFFNKNKVLTKFSRMGLKVAQNELLDIFFAKHSRKIWLKMVWNNG